jgi:hypothetical protein
MSTAVKIFGSIVALILIFAGGVDFYLTTFPGLAMLAYIWGFKL